MAIESKSIKVHPALEQKMIDSYEAFGWSLSSSQEIHSQTSHSDEDAVFVYHYTTTTNYVKLVFTREREFQNRAEITALEEEYWECFNTYMSAPGVFPGKIFWIIAGVLCVPAVIMVAVEGTDAIGAAIPALIAGIAPILLRHFCYYRPKADTAAKCLLRCTEIEEETEKLRKK